MNKMTNIITSNDIEVKSPKVQQNLLDIEINEMDKSKFTLYSPLSVSPQNIDICMYDAETSFECELSDERVLLDLDLFEDDLSPHQRSVLELELEYTQLYLRNHIFHNFEKTPAFDKYLRHVYRQERILLMLWPIEPGIW